MKLIITRAAIRLLTVVGTLLFFFTYLLYATHLWFQAGRDTG